jgi:thiol-disulfide isomerase/thioredoxin
MLFQGLHRMGFRWARIGLAPAFLALLLAGSARGADGAPDLSLRDLGGEAHNLESYRGKIVVLNFWATWCGPCAEEMPMLVKAQTRYGEHGLVVIGVSLDEDSARAKVEKFAKRKKINFPLWMGGTVEDLKRFGLGEALPATAFFDADGRIVGRVLGMLHKGDLDHRIEWMLGETQGEAPAPLVNNLGGH